jgi:hypothetical protein
VRGAASCAPRQQVGALREGHRAGSVSPPPERKRARSNRHARFFETNFFGVVRMTRAVVPHMRRRGSGRIINIGSVLGLLPMPYGALYAASKHAIEGYSESLDHELRTWGIRVSVIEPAYTRTQFEANLLEPDAKLDEYREVRAAVGKRFAELVASGDHPRVIADVVLTAARATRPKLRYPAGAACDGFASLHRLASWTPGFEKTCGSAPDLALPSAIAHVATAAWVGSVRAVGPTRRPGRWRNCGSRAPRSTCRTAWTGCGCGRWPAREDASGDLLRHGGGRDDGVRRITDQYPRHYAPWTTSHATWVVRGPEREAGSSGGAFMNQQAGAPRSSQTVAHAAHWFLIMYHAERAAQRSLPRGGNRLRSPTLRHLLIASNESDAPPDGLVRFDGMRMSPRD